ncbi:MAG: hypothetical protein R6X21_05325, partial [Candidatus Aminicenantes bacterium]
MPQNDAQDSPPARAPNGAPNGDRGGINGARANRLSSWKEIADYLDCDTRTCLRWEKSFGLPIHRLEGAKKSRVYAFRDEIDRWQREKSSLFNGKSANGAAAGGRGDSRPGERNNSATGGVVAFAGPATAPAAVFAGALDVEQRALLPLPAVDLVPESVDPRLLRAFQTMDGQPEALFPAQT